MRGRYVPLVASLTLAAIVIPAASCSYTYQFVLLNRSRNDLRVEYGFDLDEDDTRCPLENAVPPSLAPVKKIRKQFPDKHAELVRHYDYDETRCSVRLRLPPGNGLLMYEMRGMYVFEQAEARLSLSTDRHEVVYEGRSLDEAFDRRSINLLVLTYGHGFE